MSPLGVLLQQLAVSLTFDQMPPGQPRANLVRVRRQSVKALPVKPVTALLWGEDAELLQRVQRLQEGAVADRALFARPAGGCSLPGLSSGFSPDLGQIDGPNAVIKAHEPDDIQRTLRQVGTPDSIGRPQPAVADVAARLVDSALAPGNRGVTWHIHLDLLVIPNGAPAEPAGFLSRVHLLGHGAAVQAGQPAYLCEAQVKRVGAVQVERPADMRWGRPGG